MAGQREYEMLFKLNAQMSGSYSSAFRSAQNQMSQFQSAYRALKQEQGDISGFQRQQAAVDNTKAKLDMLQQQYDNIQREMQETGTYSSDLENKLLAKKAQIDKTTQALQSQIDKLNTYKQKLEEAGVDTSDLESESAALQRQLDELRKKFEEAGNSSAEFGEKGSTSASELEQAFAALGVAAILNKIGDAFRECIDASMEFESAMAGVRRTVGGSEEDIAAMGAAFKEMSTQMPITTTEIAGIATTAGQLGIAQDKVEQFTEVMAMLATTTDLTADNAATMLAQFANITHTTDYERLGSVVAALGDSTATTASKVVDMSQGMAASASIAGMSEREILAVAAAVGSLGIEAAAGSTSMSQLIQRLYKAVETGDGLEELASVAGMSASQFKNAWGESAVQALNAFIQGLNNTEASGKSAIVVLDELGINNVRQTKAILSLAEAGDLLSSTIDQANSAWEQNTALQEKANIMYGTTESQLKMMQNSWNNLKVAIGDQFTPALSALYSSVSGIMSGVTEFITEFPILSKAMSALAIGATAFAAALAAYVVVSKLATAATEALTAAMASNPYLLLGAAVIAVVAAFATFVTTAGEAQTTLSLMTETSREQSEELAELQSRYDEAVAGGEAMKEEAQELKIQIDELSEAYKNSAKTIGEWDEQHQKVIDAHKQIMEDYKTSSESVDEEAASIASLIAKMTELTGKTNLTAGEMEALQAIINKVNSLIPGANISYDVSSGLSMTTAELHAMATAYAEAAKRAADLETYLSLAAKHDTLSNDYTDALTQQALAQERYNAAYAKYQEYDSNYVDADVAAELNDAGAALSHWNDKVAESSAALSENEAEQQELEYALTESKEAQDGVIDSTEEMKNRLQELGEAYETAYKSAKQSMEGQYDLLDKATSIHATNVSTLTSNQESQEAYWLSYKDNIDTVLSYSGQITGLSEVIASLGEAGDANSVNIIAGLAESLSSGDITEVSDFVASWQTRKDALDAASQSFGDLASGYSDGVAQLQKEFEGLVEDLDMSDEAAAAGSAIISSYAQAIRDGTSEAVTAATEAAAAVAAALSDIGGPGGGHGNPRRRRFATGTESAPRGFALVGEEGPELVWFNGGEKVSTAHETEAIRRNAELYDFTSAAPVQAIPTGEYNASSKVEVGAININVEVAGADEVSTGRAEDISQQVKFAVVQALEELTEDRARRSYV